MGVKVLSRYQTAAFWFASIISVMAVIFLDLVDWSDACLVVYAINAFVAFVCASMFADWWRVKGSATSIYKWITVLLFALTFNDIVQLYARYLFVIDSVQYVDFMNSLIWEYRSVPKMIALIYLIIFALWQRFGRNSTYHDVIREEMSVKFGILSAKIVDGEVNFEGHSHEGLVLGAKIILKPRTNGTEE